MGMTTMMDERIRVVIRVVIRHLIEDNELRWSYNAFGITTKIVDIGFVSVSPPDPLRNAPSTLFVNHFKMLCDHTCTALYEELHRRLQEAEITSLEGILGVGQDESPTSTEDRDG